MDCLPRFVPLSVMGAFAEFERSLIRERQREGVVLARGRGAYRGRRRSLTDYQIDRLVSRAAAGEAKAALAREFAVYRETVHQYRGPQVTASPGVGAEA